jgi:hypothetical protein
MGTKHPMSPNSSHFIERHSSHCPFASSCATIDLSSISSPMQNINHPLVTFFILTNHTPPTNAPLLTSNLSCEWRVPISHFPNPPQSCTTKTFSPSQFIGPYSWPWSYPQPTSIFLTCLQPSLKVLCPTYRCQFINRGLAHHQHSCHTFNSSNPNLCDHLSPIPSFTPTPLASVWTWVSTLDVIKSFHLDLCYPCLYNCIPTILCCDV